MVFDIFKNRKNIVTLLLSLVIAFVFWSLAKTNEVVVVESNLALQVKVRKDLIASSVTPDSIKLKIKAKKRQHNMLKKISPVVKCGHELPGTYKVGLSESKLSFPLLLGVEDYEILFPDSVSIELDSLIKTEVSITSVKGMVFEPDKVTLVGPKSLVSNIEYLSPDSIPKGSFTTVTIENPLIEVFPGKIRVRQ
jgi:hypothetical protein